MKKHTWKAAIAVAVLAAAAAALALSAGRAPVAAQEHEVEAGQALGVVRESPERERAERKAAVGAVATNGLGPHVGTGTFLGLSRAVADLPITVPPVVTQLNPRDQEHLGAAKGSSNAKDPVVQKKRGSGPLSAPLASFDGICLPFGPPCGEASSCSCLPPDTNGEVGATQFVQTVNSDFAVYSKTGQVLRTATPINALWSGTNGECAAHNDGDPIVVYDQFAGRWLITQFVVAAAGEQYGECVAVSQTGDATGKYYLYEFDISPNVFLDYPKFGVWRDGYYMSANEFPDGTVTSAGAAAVVFERSQMLAGGPARFVWFDESAANPIGGQYIGQLPADADGSKLPPAGAPNLFAEVDDPAGIPPQSTTDTGFNMRIWKFHVDWSNPAASTFGKNGQPDYTIPVAPFVRPQCTYGYGDCALQKGGPQGLDVLGDRLMFRLGYRNLGDHDALVLNHTVKADALEGIRWYEVRNPLAGPTVYQQGTYAPDDSATNPLSRWLGSIAMDKRGDIALGYSASGVNDYPSLRYTGRGSTDPLGQMTQAEQTLFVGSGPQTEAEGRWGDYSDLTVDPADDCTYFFTSEYLAVDTLVVGTWRTRIGSFRFPGCK